MIHSYGWAKKNVGEVGRVVKSSRSIALVTGLTGAVLGESVSFEMGAHGVVTRLLPDKVEVMVFADQPLPYGEMGARTGKPLMVTVGDGMLGETFNALGYVENGGRDVSRESESRAVEVVAGGIDQRAEITKFFETGVTIVDTVVPISMGQRELVIGDQKCGKTHFLLSTIKHQAKMGTVCVIGLIGKEQSEIMRIERELERAKVREQCVIIAEPASASAAALTVVPFTAMTVAEYWRDLGRDSLVILDDLSYHSYRYREMALLSDRYPGRDAYPSDIFYLHARLLERAGSFVVNGKAVTITCLPVVTTIEGEISGYIETNIMSMTDGHLFFDKNLFFDGVRPAVNIFLSVTRVGRQTQHKIQREVGQRILKVMAEYGELKRFLRFGSELTPKVKESMRLAHGIKEALKQNGHMGVCWQEQIYALACLWAGVWEGKEIEKYVERWRENKATRGEIVAAVENVDNFEQLVRAVKSKEKEL